MTHRSRIVRRKRRTMRGGYGQGQGQVGIFTREGGRRRRTMRGGLMNIPRREGGRKRSMRGGQVTSISQFYDGGRRRRTMRGGWILNTQT